MRSGTTVVIGLFVGPLLLISSPILLMGGAMWWSDCRFRHDSPLAAMSVQSTDEATEREFRGSVQASFPIGTTVDAMQAVLRKQGFLPGAGQFRPGPAWVLEVNSNFVCYYFWEVFWTSSATHTLTSVDAALNRRCL